MGSHTAALAATDRARETLSTPGLNADLPWFDYYNTTRLSGFAYVGDRLDFDIKPAARAGLFTVRLQRGPWGYILRPGEPPGAAHLPEGAPTLTVATLSELVPKLMPPG